MTIWVLETSSRGRWDNMAAKGVYLTERKGLRAYHKLRKSIRKQTGLRVQWCTDADGCHVSATGMLRLRLRPVVIT